VTLINRVSPRVIYQNTGPSHNIGTSVDEAGFKLSGTTVKYQIDYHDKIKITLMPYLRLSRRWRFKSRSFGSWRRVVLWQGTKVSENLAASIFTQQHYTASQPGISRPVSNLFSTFTIGNFSGTYAMRVV